MKRTVSGLFWAAVLSFAVLPEATASSLCDGVAGNLVTNCGFEAGDFTSWTLSGNDVPGELNNLYGVEGTDPLFSIAPNSGFYQAFFSDLNDNATTLEQTIPTILGVDYTVSFYLAQAETQPIVPPYSADQFSASFGGTLLASLSVPVQGYTEYSYTLAATSTASDLSLVFGDDLGVLLLDDVSVVAVGAPEPSAGQLCLGGSLLFLVYYRSRNRRATL